MRRGLAAGCAVATVAIVAAIGTPSGGAPASEVAVSVVPAGATDTPLCPELERGKPGRGGCTLHARSAAIAFTVLTVFRAHALSRCTVDMQLSVAGDGELIVGKVETNDIGGQRTGSTSGQSAACGDIRPCRRFNRDAEPVDEPPWPGRIRTVDGRMAAEVEACFDTCVGQFKGQMSLPLRRTAAGGWLMLAPRATLDESGFELSGRWQLRPERGGKLAIAARRVG